MKSNIVLILLAAVVAGSCTVYSELYLRNTTSSSQRVTLISREAMKNQRFEFLYADSLIRKIEYKTYNYLDKKITVVGQGKSVSFSMPPNSTLHLGAGRNFQKQFEMMVVGTDTIDLNTTGGFQTAYEKMSKYAVWYDMK